MGFMGGFYFWWPKVFGYFLDDKLGKVHFWLTLIGFNLTFGPMHILGLQGMSRRIPTYRDGLRLRPLEHGVHDRCLHHRRRDARVLRGTSCGRGSGRPSLPAPGPDPWDARSLEWSIPSPTPEHNFDDDPVVTQLDDFWHRKYQEDEHGQVGAGRRPEEVAMPGDAPTPTCPRRRTGRSCSPLGLPLIGYGVIFNLIIAAIGGLLVVAGIVGWALEPPDDADLPPNGHGHPDARDRRSPRPPPRSTTEADEREEVTVGD